MAASHPSEPRRLRLRLGEEGYSLESSRIVVGRSRSCDVRLREDSVSRLHAALVWRGEHLILEDLGSSNGTWVNGERVLSPRNLAAGDRIRFGSLRGIIELAAEQVSPRAPERASTATQDRTAGVIPPAPAGLLWRLLALALDALLFAAGSLASFAPLATVLGFEWLSRTPLPLPAARPTKVLIAGGCTLLWALYAFYYVVHGWARRGGTPGMRLLGLRLMDWRQRIPIGYTRAWLRLIAVMVTALTLGLGFLTVPFQKDRKALHDMLAGTLVMRRPRRVGHLGACRSKREGRVASAAG